jgi:hypothetical protein
MLVLGLIVLASAASSTIHQLIDIPRYGFNLGAAIGILALYLLAAFALITSFCLTQIQKRIARIENNRSSAIRPS